MPLARFVTFHDVPEGACGALPRPSFAVMIARSGDGVVLVFNRYRAVWELPGGFIDAGESPLQGAERELSEEAGCAADNSVWLGIVEVDDGRAHFGAVFRCDVATLPDHFASNEIAAITLWRRHEIPQPLGHSDGELLRRFG
jgi:8-oxo-dGTP diphosphatase